MSKRTNHTVPWPARLVQGICRRHVHLWKLYQHCTDGADARSWQEMDAEGFRQVQRVRDSSCKLLTVYVLLALNVVLAAVAVATPVVAIFAACMVLTLLALAWPALELRKLLQPLSRQEFDQRAQEVLDIEGPAQAAALHRQRCAALRDPMEIDLVIMQRLAALEKLVGYPLACSR